MNKKMINKVVAEKVVNAAVQTSRMPNQGCPFFLGKPNPKIDLTSDDYEQLYTFMKKN